MIDIIIIIDIMIIYIQRRIYKFRYKEKYRNHIKMTKPNRIKAMEEEEEGRLEFAILRCGEFCLICTFAIQILLPFGLSRY